MLASIARPYILEEEDEAVAVTGSTERRPLVVTALNLDITQALWSSAVKVGLVAYRCPCIIVQFNFGVAQVEGSSVGLVIVDTPELHCDGFINSVLYQVKNAPWVATEVAVAFFSSLEHVSVVSRLMKLVPYFLNLLLMNTVQITSAFAKFGCQRIDSLAVGLVNLDPEWGTALYGEHDLHVLIGLLDPSSRGASAVKAALAAGTHNMATFHPPAVLSRMGRKDIDAAILIDRAAVCDSQRPVGLLR